MASSKQKSAPARQSSRLMAGACSADCSVAARKLSPRPELLLRGRQSAREPLQRSVTAGAGPPWVGRLRDARATSARAATAETEDGAEEALLHVERGAPAADVNSQAAPGGRLGAVARRDDAVFARVAADWPTARAGGLMMVHAQRLQGRSAISTARSHPDCRPCGSAWLREGTGKLASCFSIRAIRKTLKRLQTP
ncbi:hypothetical protein HPB51_029502 [Rhipicephalus microplus]|uniref:Uncharacterized protein n=1 Tax=Rhipicephalus microplus TaxID=6941 RepID=A0A9J6CTN2_RHIMP|nr:hypothetical protein HPB51_029502 [Rhipicephalus microplus]